MPPLKDVKILYKGKWGVVLRARVGRTPKPLMAEICFQFGDRKTVDISDRVWDETRKCWVVE
jgi:hypothetical protein